MKRILATVTMLTVIGMNVKSQVTFQKIFGGNGIKQDYTYDMHKTSDGGYVLGGVTENYPTGVRRSYVIKTDANGDTLWTSIYGDTCKAGNAQQYINDICQSVDGGYLGVGGMIPCGGSSTTGGEITRLDANGNVLWSKTCATGKPDPYPVIQCKDGNFIFGGYCTGIGAGLEDGFLTKIDANGDTLWSRTYGGAGNEWFYHILQTPDGGYLAAGKTDGFGQGVVNTNDNIYLVKTDANGNLQWSKAYGTSTGNQDAFGHCLQPTTDGGYIIAGAAQNQIAQTDSSIFLMKIDASGNMKWAKYFSGVFGHAVKQAADKGYLIVGTGNYGTTGLDVVLIKTDSLGTLQWSRTFGGSGNENGWLLEIADDGGYVTGGWTKSFGNLAEHIYFVKTDASGNSSCNENASPGVIESVAPFVSGNVATQVGIGPNTESFTPLFQRGATIIDLCSTVGVNERSNNTVSVFPNPASYTLTIDLSGQATIKILNMHGQLIESRTTNDNNVNIDVSNLPGGVYVVEARTDKGISVSKFIKE